MKRFTDHPEKRAFIPNNSNATLGIGLNAETAKSLISSSKDYHLTEAYKQGLRNSETVVFEKKDV